MSYIVSGVAAISFPVPALQNDTYSVPGSHRALPSLADAQHTGVESQASLSKGDAQASPVRVGATSTEAKHALPVDTVTLSTSQKVLKLQREGESALQIAATLNLPTKEVQSDLHVDTHVAQSFTVSPVTTPLSGNTTATVSAPTVHA